MAIAVGDILPLRLILPFSAVEEEAKCLVVSTAPLVVSSITRDRDMDRTIGPVGASGVTYQQTLTTGVTGALWQVVDVQRLTQNYLAASVVAGVVAVPAGGYAYVPITGGIASEDMSVVNNVIIYGDHAEATEPTDGAYFTGGTMALETSAGNVIVTAEMVIGYDLNRDGEVINDVVAMFPRRVTTIGEPEGIPLLGAAKVEQDNREIAFRLSHNLGVSVDVTLLAGQFFTRQQAN